MARRWKELSADERSQFEDLAKHSTLTDQELADRFNVSWITAKNAKERNRWYRDPNWQPEPTVRQVPTADFDDAVLGRLGKDETVHEIANTLNVAPRWVAEALDRLREAGHNIQITDGVSICRQKTASADNFTHIAQFDSLRCRFAIVSDTHLGSIHERLDDLRCFYEIARREGCERVYHAGDLTTGSHVFAGQENEIKVWGQDNQVEYAIEHYPDNGLPTDVISGNHDLREWEKGGSDPVKAICDARDDLTYLGKLGAIIEFPRGVRMQLVHPTGGGSYALTYQSQRWVDNLEGGNKPHILVFGHWHTWANYERRNVHVLHAGAWESQSLWLMRKGLQPSICGTIMDINISEDGSVNRLGVERIKFF